MKKVVKRKGRSTEPAVGVDQDVVGLITTLVQKLVSLETKIDTVLARLQKPAEASRPQQPVSQMPAQQRPRDARPMFAATCADCGKHCEVPFKPSAGRSVYCKECFARRRANGTFQTRVEAKPPVPSSVPQPSPAAQVTAKPPAPAAKKRAPVKKAKTTKKKAAK